MIQTKTKCDGQLATRIMIVVLACILIVWVGFHAHVWHIKEGLSLWVSVPAAILYVLLQCLLLRSFSKCRSTQGPAPFWRLSKRSRQAIDSEQLRELLNRPHKETKNAGQPTDAAAASRGQ